MISSIEKNNNDEVKESILIVDDDEGSLKTLSFIFNKRGFKVETIKTGKEALEKIQRVFFNIILLDIRLPDVEGIELIKPIKKLQPDVEVLMITAYANVDAAVGL